jgi:lipid-A-disaccharide synthase
MPLKILVSAGEASGDLYASRLVEAVRARLPEAEFFGCTGPRLRAAGVRQVVDAQSLAVVGIVEVVRHIPRIWGEYRRLLDTARRERPALAILTDSPDFHLRLARRLKKLGIPVVYLVAPQVWAWRKGRLAVMRRVIDHLLCIFPFEERFFRSAGVVTTYIGHPLAGLVRPSLSREEFFRKHGIDGSRPVIAVLPGSRKGETERHMPVLLEAVELLHRATPFSFVLAASPTVGAGFFRRCIGSAPIRIVEGEIWDVLAHADAALAASGTVAMEAALCGTPMVVYYRVSPLTWLVGRPLVKVPFYSMVNMVAGREVVPELIQQDATGSKLAAHIRRLLGDTAARERMLEGLKDVAARLDSGDDPMRRAAGIVEELVRKRSAHVS